MPYRISKTFEIESGHMLSKHPDLCRFPHGHSRRVEVVFETDSLDQNDMVCDFYALKDSVRICLDKLDHAICVNTQDSHFTQLKAAFGDRVVEFEGMDPTSEVMAKNIFDIVRARLAALTCNPSAKFPVRATVRVVKIRLWETSRSWAEYSEV